CWKTVAVRVLPFVLGAALASAVFLALWPSSESPQQTTPVDGSSPDVVNVPLVLPVPVLPPVPDRGPRPRVVLDAKAGPVWATTFTRDGQTLVNGSENGSVTLWNLETGDTRQTLQPQKAGNIWAVDVSPDGAYTVLGCHTSTAWIYDLTPPERVALLSHPTSVKAAAFSPDGKPLVTGDRGGIIRRWHVPEWVPDDPLEGQEGTVHALAYCPHGALLASGGAGGESPPGGKGAQTSPPPPGGPPGAGCAGAVRPRSGGAPR